MFFHLLLPSSFFSFVSFYYAELTGTHNFSELWVLNGWHRAHISHFNEPHIIAVEWQTSLIKRILSTRYVIAYLFCFHILSRIKSMLFRFNWKRNAKEQANSRNPEKIDVSRKFIKIISFPVGLKKGRKLLWEIKASTVRTQSINRKLHALNICCWQRKSQTFEKLRQTSSCAKRSKKNMSGPQWRENKTDDNNDNGIGNHANSEYEKKNKKQFSFV